mmetsp:Transcript_11504/g.23174  ORF Transcript_11504/g.23174 Transcript_11504/m.23174 type:complete len:230 (-) Transcript_11504:1844-2533(-)
MSRRACWLLSLLWFARFCFRMACFASSSLLAFSKLSCFSFCSRTHVSKSEPFFCASLSFSSRSEKAFALALLSSSACASSFKYLEFSILLSSNATSKPFALSAACLRAFFTIEIVLAVATWSCSAFLNDSALLSLRLSFALLRSLLSLSFAASTACSLLFAFLNSSSSSCTRESLSFLPLYIRFCLSSHSFKASIAFCLSSWYSLFFLSTIFSFSRRLSFSFLTSDVLS